jgi:AcrR family transcriptional regulator
MPRNEDYPIAESPASTSLSGRQRQQAETRERLLGAAAEVFAERGYHAAKLEEVAGRAGYSTGAVYSNFSGKEELFLALADREVADRVAEIEAVAEAAEGGDQELIEEATGQFRDFIARDPAWPLLFYEFWSYGIRNPRLRQEFEERRCAVRDALARAIAAVTKRSGLKARYPGDQLATAVAAVINGLAFERVANPEAIPDELFSFVMWSLLGSAFVNEEERHDLTGR